MNNANLKTDSHWKWQVLVEDIKNVASMAEKLSEDLKESGPENIKVVTSLILAVFLYQTISVLWFHDI